MSSSDQSGIRYYESSTYWLAPARNFRSSARLHLQHLLCQNTLGYLLEPHIEKDVSGSTQLAVADLGCGNGIWLLQLHDELAKRGVTATVSGYDINPINFPASAWLPSTIQLHQLDILSQSLPDDVLGTFDVVHVRAFVSIIVNSNTTPLLKAVLSLLKPGGWLQWEEVRAERFIVQSPSPEVSSTSCDTIVAMLKAAADAQGLSYEFVGCMDRHLADHGFDNVHVTTTKKRQQDYKGWTEDYLMVFEGLADHFPTKEQAPQAPMTKESWAQLFQQAVYETEKGVAIHQEEIVTAVGRKPLNG
ncbi:hypothetical protein B0I35DRAFT_363898 [Stachybotrys elegans]|uniref:Methyltransferase domain-containing protein n=1 Tax=Stachybotrys elegans TaxID=80388 RepID=A0A8K0SH21_9HYPO|nr:hypothetical protein B0I35DRAFT_363898 [Stachybotrys elegans]